LARERDAHVRGQRRRHPQRIRGARGGRRACAHQQLRGVGRRRGRPADERSTFDLAPERFRYGHSKWLAEQEVLAAVRAGLAAVLVLPAVILGPRDVNFISGSLIREAARGLLVAVPPGGVNIVHVDDVVAGQLAAAERGVPGERYILAGENLTHGELARVVCATVGVRPPLLGVPRAALPLLAGAGIGERAVGPRLPLNAEQLRLSGEEMYLTVQKRDRFGLLTPARVAVEDAYRWYKERDMQTEQRRARAIWGSSSAL
jgi:dihydroflavonol-4-reductase